ncbi:hypothetical protein BOV90_06030 [Solemya velum gill symbiont]|uniref:HTH cro/C1-type domain-containing protein n=1 Tax=Solemya velum gill symbiont TaxID=2340 RepID=A0A1T2D8R1_SOVGS|nr:hypothetical protein BOV88_11250 [Solemya velum gill symbiont]OOY36865.1 hypothetical protein BOV89_10165 [Solemya velum gill symbiont]OOY40025.1 hypothetical protein BOV90_06030 [Solemya velum gill symbiont]OOY43449.1 hypothetical protein BOV92_11185 [Solemya velum gill symbiont]OOY46511.1 hypothetical protein BOV93_10070 [Solemya velum gill symbiont]
MKFTAYEAYFISQLQITVNSLSISGDFYVTARKSFAKILKQRRLENDLSQEELAHIAGLSMRLYISDGVQ